MALLEKIKQLKSLLIWAVALTVLVIAAFLSYAVMQTTRTIAELLTENKQLKAAIANLTAESQIGYAKVLKQEQRDGRLFTKLLFVETDRDDPTRRILEKEYEIEGDIVHFDALVVRFDTRLVMDGRARSLYLWRRVYGEEMKPSAGFAIETFGAEPQRYAEIFARLPLKHRELFWQEIWGLAHQTEKLKDLGVSAIYGSVVYTELRPGVIYLFKIDNVGGLVREIVPDL